jgi:hypothetical protein
MQPSQTYGGVSHQQPNVARLLAIVPGREEETDDLLPDDPNVRSVVHHPIFSLLPDPALRSQKKVDLFSTVSHFCPTNPLLVLVLVIGMILVLILVLVLCWSSLTFIWRSRLRTGFGFRCT